MMEEKKEGKIGNILHEGWLSGALLEVIRFPSCS